MHVLIPHFSSLSPAYVATLDSLAANDLPALSAWLSQAKITAEEPLAEDAELLKSAPHERWISGQARSLPAAAQQHPAALPGALLQLCNWHVGREQLVLTNVESVDVTAAEDAALQAAITPLLIEDGFVVTPLEPGRWHLQHPSLHTLETTSPLRAQGRPVTHWLPTGEFAKVWKRISNELQMLLYSHALNDARAERGQLAINSVWLWGTGTMAEIQSSYFAPAERFDWSYRFTSDSDKTLPTLTIIDLLTTPVLGEDWLCYAGALRLVDAQLRPLLAQPGVKLTLCGERRWVTLGAAKQGFFSKLFGAPPKPFAQLIPAL